MTTKITCPRCGKKATVTYSARGTERIHAHKCPHGKPCRIDGILKTVFFLDGTPDCDECFTAGCLASAIASAKEDAPR